ncbi:MAG: flagellar export chaperone FliS [Mariprofundales bacterium]
MTGYKAYRGQQVRTSSPLELVLLAYEALASATFRARDAKLAGDILVETENVQHALAAVSELMNGLDYDRGGEIAANLGSLYVYITRQLMVAHGEDDDKTYLEVMNLINELRSGWMGLRDQQATEGMPPLPTNNEPHSLAMAA